MKIDKKYNVLIIGAGDIGAFYDDPASTSFLSHAHAFTEHDGFHLIGFVDKIIKKSERAVEMWGGKAFSTLEEAFHQEKIDVACVCVPDEYHYDVLKALAFFPLVGILAEKPLAKTLEQADELKSLLGGKDILVCVNYFRSFIPEFLKIREEIAAGLYGEYVTGTGYYGKGFLHAGSHVIDLLRFLFFEVVDSLIINQIFDCYDDDPSISAILKFKSDKPFYLQAVDRNLYNASEIDLIFEKRRIRFIQKGLIIEKYEIQKNKIFPQINSMVKTEKVLTSFTSYSLHSVAHLYDCLQGKTECVSSLDDGYKTLRTCKEILNHV